MCVARLHDTNPFRSNEMKATALLEKQHRDVEAIFKKLERQPGNPAPLLEQLANDLAGHMAIEQDIFYPAVRAVDPDLVLESFEEHALAEIALKRLVGTPLDDPSYLARLAATKELVLHHVELEERTLLPEVERSLGGEELLRLGKQMEVRFAEVVARGFAAAVPKGFSETSSDVARLRSGA